MLFSEINLYEDGDVNAYFATNYPKTINALHSFRLTRAKDLIRIIESLGPGEQLTFHCFPGVHITGNAYIFPRFLRVEGGNNHSFRVTREKSIRERYPVTMTSKDVVSYYYELADLTYLQSEMEICWAESWSVSENRR